MTNLKKTAGYKLGKLLKKANDQPVQTTPSPAQPAVQPTPSTSQQLPVPVTSGTATKPGVSGIGSTGSSSASSVGGGLGGSSPIKPMIVNPYLNFRLQQQGMRR